MKNKNNIIIQIAVSLLFSSYVHAVDDIWDTYSDTWVAVDELWRIVNTSETGISAPKENRAVGMFYYICNGPHGTNGDPIYDITEILKTNSVNPQFGPEGKPHWWGKPKLGYYVNTDDFVYDKHLQMLTDARVDFLFMDVTNAFTYDDAVKRLMAAIDRRTNVGLPSPKLVYTINANASGVVKHLWDVFYSNPDYDKYWFYYRGKPLLLVNIDDIASLSDEIKTHFTTRHCWAWMGDSKPDRWGWLENYPQKCGWTYVNGLKKKEQISVSTAQHATSKIGKSYHSGKEPPLDQYAVSEDTPKGLYFSEQWEQAFSQSPPIVMITQFNECMAGRFIIKSPDEFGECRPGGIPTLGESFFVDAYNAEFNRDIEPSTNPLIRDNYYLQMVSNVRRYKGVRTIPTPSAPQSITLDGDMFQWTSVTPEFRDDIGDITHRSTQGFQNMAPMTNNSGRNDIVMAKLTKDNSNMYFYVKTAANFSNYNFSKQWMILLINSDCDYKTGWNGYDYAVMKNPTDSKYTLMKCVGKDYQWAPVTLVTRFVKQNEMYFALKKSDLGITIEGDIDFKWADNIPENPDILDFIDQGDVAPNGRFNYRYKGSLVPMGIKVTEAKNILDIRALRATSQKVLLSYNLPTASDVIINVYNLQGGLVKTIKQDSQMSSTVDFSVLAAPIIIKVITNFGTKIIKLP